MRSAPLLTDEGGFFHGTPFHRTLLFTAPPAKNSIPPYGRNTPAKDGTPC